MDSVINIYSKADGNIDSFASSISTAGVNLKDTKEMLGSLKTDLSSTIEKLNNIKNSGSYDMLLKVLGLDADSFGSFVASPVEIETEAIYPIATYGSAMAPFYTVLAIWVGGLILVAIIHVGVKPQKEHFRRSAISGLFRKIYNIFPYRSGTGTSCYAWRFVLYRNPVRKPV